MARFALRISLLRDSMKTRALTPLRVGIKRSSPRGLIAEIMFKWNRWPVAGTTGVCPRLAQVVPEWKSDRTPDSPLPAPAGLLGFGFVLKSYDPVCEHPWSAWL